MSDADERDRTFAELAKQAKATKTPICGNCRWWHLLPQVNVQGQREGECRGMPVQITHLFVQAAEPSGQTDENGEPILVPKIYPAGRCVGYPPVAANQPGCRVFEPHLEVLTVGAA